VSIAATDNEKLQQNILPLELAACSRLIPVQVDIQNQKERSYRMEHFVGCYQQVARFVLLGR
jgi:hypothetical protein